MKTNTISLERKIMMQSTPRSTSFSLSMPNLLLRLEGLTVFVAAIAVYAHLGGSALAFIVLLLAPDISAVGYAINPRVGSWCYNAAHVYMLPALLAALGLATGQPTLVELSCIWFAHIGMDRTVGYGLKYATEFKDTHFNRV
jgi:hypothetical protein